MVRRLGPLKIESLAYGGKGIARADGQVLFVDGALPGDLLTCRVTREKKRYAEAVVEELITPSPARRTPPCPVADQCGGCQWQALNYAEQCRWKQSIFTDLLQRNVGIGLERIEPIVPAPDEWGYRSRVQFKCVAANGRFLTGFYRTGSHVVVDVDACPVVDPAVNAVLARLKPIIAGSSYLRGIPQIDMESGSDGQVRVVIHALRHGRQIADLCRPLAEEAGFSLLVQSTPSGKPQVLHGPADLTVQVDDPPVSLRYGPGGFAQINQAQNRALVEAVLASANLKRTESVLDLYCGMGNFSLPLARRAGQVVGVEESAQSIAMARVNATAHQIDNASFYCQSAEGFLRRWRDRPFDLVMIDPPRSGARAVMDELLECRPGKILYVSCDPSTLARDLTPLVQNGYHVVSSRPFDMFPQTYHLESLTTLIRTDC